METMRLTASEREALLRLNVAYEILARDVDPVLHRLKAIKYARRDVGLIKSKIRRIMEAIPYTIPENQRMSYARSVEMAAYTVGVRRPGAQTRDMDNYGLWLSYGVINRMLDGLHDHCLMCSSDKSMRKACELRKALAEIPNDAPEREDGDCPFYTLI